MNFIRKLIPPEKWRLPVIIILGIFSGLALYSFYISNAPSYLGDKPETLLVRSHVEAKTAWDKGASEEQMKDILNDIRRAQWRWDFSAAGHGNSFHSPVEISRIIAGGIAFAQEARVRLARVLSSLGYNQEVPYPDINTKTKAQEYTGLDMKKLNEEKQVFIGTIIPEWMKGGMAGK